MGECCSTQIGLENELSTIHIIDEKYHYITQIQAAIRHKLTYNSYIDSTHTKLTHSFSERAFFTTNCHTEVPDDNKPHLIENKNLIYVQNCKFEENITYSGYINKIRNQREGWGQAQNNDGSSYIGYWKANMANGNGKLIFASGDTYDGSWKNYMMHGFGKYIHKDGSFYFGEWKNDYQNNYGMEHWNDGSKYEGEFINGKKNGDGKFT